MDEWMRQTDLNEGKPAKVAIEFADQMLATGEFPHVEALLGDGDAATAWARIGKFMNDAGRLVRGLDAVLDGLEARFTTKRR